MHDWVAPVVTDQVLEDILMGCESYSQRKTSVIKFLRELYNYRIIDSALIFKGC